MDNYTFSQFKSEVANVTTSLMQAQKKIHSLTVISASHAFSNRMNTEFITHLANSLDNVGGSFNLGHYLEYISEFFGVNVKHHESGVGFDVAKNPDWKGKRGKAQLEKIKKTPFFEWQVPDPILKTPTLPVESFATVAARALLLGELTEEELEKELTLMLGKIRSKRSDEKIIAWVDRYNKQHKKAA